MCCDPWENGEAVGVCPSCGAEVNEDGEAVAGCNYSPILCEICGDQPCDLSC